PPKPAPPKPAPRPAPMPVAVPSPAPAPNAPTGVVEPQPPAPPIEAPAAPPAPAPAPPAPPAPPKIELPSSDAAYLNNPKPSYPAISKRLGEQGKVVLRVLIGTDGLPQKVEVNKSSGFERLDRQAQDAVMRWRFAPGKRNGVPETMWNLVPVNFVLE
ncbi:MAG: energy transducer TonB, partial [Comamonadaceae bacterium]